MVACLARWLGPDVGVSLARLAAGWSGLSRACLIAGVWLGWPAALLAQATPVVQADGDAQDAASFRVAVLLQTQSELSGLAGAIDGAMLRDLSDLAGIERPTVSPIDYAEIQLAVGCSDEGRSCLVAIAQMLQVEAVVVRRLQLDGERVVLTLLHFDARTGGEPAHADRVAERAEAERVLPQAVPSLVRALFGIPEPRIDSSAAVSEAHAPSTVPLPPVQRQSSPAGLGKIGVLTWVALAAGVGVLGAGVAIGASANGDYDEFKARPVRSQSDALQAEDRFATVETKAVVANVLMPSGAAILAFGGVLLVLDLSRHEERATVALRPLPGGALLTLSGVRGGL